MRGWPTVEPFADTGRHASLALKTDQLWHEAEIVVMMDHRKLDHRYAHATRP
jgi:hypothetical protein